MKTYTKRKIAEIQLERAISLFSKEKDFVSALTLAGAAEEILCKMTERNGDTPAIQASAEFLAMIEENTDSPTIERIKEWRNHLVYFRNGLKHFNNPKENHIIMNPKDEAESMIERAISNYYSLFEDYSDAMHDFVTSTLKEAQ